jgi:glucokinase
MLSVSILGTFFVRIVITDIGGEVIYSTELESGMGAGREEVLQRTFSAVREAIATAPIDGRPFLGIGLGHSGVIDSRRGLVLSFPRPGQTEQWKNVPLQKMLEDEFGVPALLEDSVRTIAMSEAQYGAGADLDDYIYVYVGMGVGSAIFINGTLYRGSGGSAGEFGHITVAENGPLCCCGNTGCLEAVASCAAIIETVKAAIKMGVTTKVNELAEGKLDRISIEMIAEARDQNDSLAFRVMSQAASHI